MHENRNSLGYVFIYSIRYRFFRLERRLERPVPR